MEQEQQNVTASVEHAACFERPSNEAQQVRKKLNGYLYQFLEDKSTTDICVTLAITKGNVLVPTLYLH